MLTSARPLFQHVPGAFCDPAGLAEQQAAGAVSLIVAHYDEATLGPVYDAFVATSGGLVAVARTTPDYRFPVMPADALAQFHERRDAGHAPTLSLFEVSEVDCSRFLETVFYQECLKLHVDGPASAALVAAQLARSCCADGVLEFNDFSDPAAPRLHLADLAASDATEMLLADLLDGVQGRVLLYDRSKNRAALPGRTGLAFDLSAAVEQADRLARTRRSATPDLAHGDSAPASIATSLSAEAVQDPAEALLVDRAKRPDGSLGANATTLGALVAELQGRPVSPAPIPLPPGRLDGTELRPLLAPAPAPRSPTPSPPAPTASVSDAAEQSAAEPADAPLSTDSVQGSLVAAAPQVFPRHPLATELDRLRADVYDLFEDAVGRDRAAEHETHVLGDADIPSPVPPHRTPDYLRALLTGEPPKRWHFFKRARTKVYPAIAGRLLAFHAANGHESDPAAVEAIHEVTRLWTRLHR